VLNELGTMASFFRMGRQPDAFHLKFGYQGYTSSKNEAAPRLEVRARPRFLPGATSMSANKSERGKQSGGR
jgi:hypothetical protein